MNSMQSMNEIKKRLESIQASRLKIDCEHQQVIATLSVQKNQNSQKVAGRHQQKEQAIQTAYNSRIHENERLIRSLQINIEGFRKCLSDAAFSEALNRTIGDACVDLSRLEELMANIQDTSLAGGIKRTLRKNGMKSRAEMMADYVSLATTYVTILQREVNKLKSDCFQEITQIKNRANQEQSQSDNYLQNKNAEEEQRYKRLINANQEELVKLFNSDLCKNYGTRLNVELRRTGHGHEDWKIGDQGLYDPNREVLSYMIGYVCSENKTVDPTLWKSLTQAVPEGVSGNCIRIPLTFSQQNAKRFFVQYDGYSKEKGHDFVQYFILQKMRCSVLENVQVFFMDYTGRGKSLGVLSAPLKDNEKIKLYVINDRNDILTKLSELNSYIDHVTAELGGSYPDIYHYNAHRMQTSQYPLLQETILVIHDVDEAILSEGWEKLRTIWTNAASCGINIILTANCSLEDIKQRKSTSHSDMDLSFVQNDIQSYHVIFKKGNSTITNSKKALLFLPNELKQWHRSFISEYRQQYSQNQHTDNSIQTYISPNNTLPLWDATKGIKIDPMIEDRPHGRLTSMTLGTGKAVHSLITGAAGSGKSVFLHTIIYSVLAHYSPNDVQLWLVDYKKTEFARYIECPVPHIRAILLEDDPDFTASLLKMISDVYTKRKNEFYNCKVKDIEEYRDYSKKNQKPLLPRILVIIDEFHNMSQHLCDKSLQTEFRKLLAECRSTGITFVFADQERSAIQLPMDQVENTIAMGGKMESIKETMADKDANQFISENMSKVLQMGQGKLMWWSPDTQSLSFYQGLNSTSVDHKSFLKQVSERTDCKQYPQKNRIIVDTAEQPSFNSSIITTLLNKQKDPNRKVIFLGTPNTIKPYALMNLTYEMPRQNIAIYGVNDKTVDNYYSTLQSIVKSLRLQKTRVVVLGKGKYPQTREFEKKKLHANADLFIKDVSGVKHFLNDLVNEIDTQADSDLNTLIVWCDFGELYTDLEKTDTDTSYATTTATDLQSLITDPTLLNNDFASNLLLTAQDSGFKLTQLNKLIGEGSFNGVYHVFSFASHEDMKKLSHGVRDMIRGQCDHSILMFPLSDDEIANFGFSTGLRKKSESGFAVHLNAGIQNYFRPYTHE